MPMAPSPLAAVAYGAMKVVGYAYFAYGLNIAWGRSVSPLRFGFGKTAIGLAAGSLYLLLLVPAFHLQGSGDLLLFLWAFPVRLVAWFLAIWTFYGIKRSSASTFLAVLLGTVLSYGLDGVMLATYQYFPGMRVPWC